MTDTTWEIRVVLSNGETRHLLGSQGDAEYATNVLEAFTKAQGDFGGDWLETKESSMIARAYIVEADTVSVDTVSA
jgi:hypothetical protein